MLWPLTAYLLGSVSTAVLVARLLAVPDPRAHGSGNPGATNVLRLGGRRAAAWTLAGDVLKGLLPVLAARTLHLPATWVAATALCAFLGHLFPVFFGFRGGKGVATAFGVLLALNPLLGALTGLTWLATAALFRYSSLAALTAASVAPVYALWLLPGPGVAVTLAMSLLLLWRHRGNIRKLRAGLEARIGH